MPRGKFRPIPLGGISLGQYPVSCKGVGMGKAAGIPGQGLLPVSGHAATDSGQSAGLREMLDAASVRAY